MITEAQPAMWRIAAVSVVAAIFLAACSGATAVEVPLAQLVAEQESYDGQTVVTEGTVAAVRDSPSADAYFVLQDAADHRVRLLPDEAAAPHEGDNVVVTGVFRFRQQSGRDLRVDGINAVP